MEIGDIVRLKSGSPPLTVTAVTPVPGSYSVEVTWIDDAQGINSALLPIEALIAQSGTS